jgi:hypothetical protein
MLIDEEVYLEHYGVLGMKWGVRKDRRLQRAERVASGKASRGERVRFALTDTSAASVRRNKGLEGAAANRARELSARKERIQAGKTTVRDIIALSGGDRLMVLGRNAGIHKTKAPSVKRSTSRSEVDKSLRAAMKEHKRLVESGELTKEQVRAGNIGFGRNVAGALLVGGLGGVVVGKGIKKALGR